MKPIRFAATLFTAAWLAGCKAGPNFAPPHEPVPDQYAGASPSAQSLPAEAPRPMASAEPASFWWQEFRDPELDALIDEATRGNLDLKAAYLRILESRIEVQAARAQGLPSLNATAAYTREQLGVAGILQTSGYTPGSTSSAATEQLIAALERPFNLYQVGFDASWELDLFGKVSRSVEAADAQSASAVESRNDLLVTLEAEVASDYLQLRAAQLLRRTTLDLIAEQREVAELTQNRQEHGLASEPEVDAARALATSLEAQLPQYDETIAVSKHALAVLTGQPPAAFDVRFGSSGDLPALPHEVPVGLPSTLARRRPDIRRSEAALHASLAEVGVSVASLFPQVSLAGSYGVRNTGTRYLFDWQSQFYTFGPQISLPIFQGGALIANVRLARAQAAEAALSYRNTVLLALRDVEDGLTQLQSDARRTASLKETVGADQRALDVDTDAYAKGLITYIEVLTQQVQTVQARQQLAQGELTQCTDLVKLYKALGGGW